MKNKKITLLIISNIALIGCSAMTEPNTNYVRTGLFKDRFDEMYYHYAETGKTININEHNAINAYAGIQQGGHSEIINNRKSNAYWEINYQLTF